MKRGLTVLLSLILVVSATRMTMAAKKTPTTTTTTPTTSTGTSGSTVTASGTLAGKRIFVDPGHGGTDWGAVGMNGLPEKNVNLQVATALKNCLVEYGGATVRMSRTDDTTLTLGGRTTDANNWGAYRFISVHHNASADRTVNGTETYSYSATGTSADLRNKVQAQLLKWGYLANRGALTANFYVLRYTNMPAILTEASFISNPAEEARLRDAGYLWREGYYIYKGVCDHYGVGY